MPSTLIQLYSKFRWVTWSLVSKRLARTCTLQRSGESERSKTCSTTPAQWQRPWQRPDGGLFWRSSAPQCRSGSGQLLTPGHPIIQKKIAVRWNDLMMFFFVLYWYLHAFTSARPSSQAKSHNALNHMFWVQGRATPGHVKEPGIQLSSCLLKTHCLLRCTRLYLYHPLSPNLTERKPSKFSRPQGLFLGHYKSAGYPFECSSWHHKSYQSVELLVVSQVDPPLLGGWNLHVLLKEAKYSEHEDKIKDKFQFKLSAESICMRRQRSERSTFEKCSHAMPKSSRLLNSTLEPIWYIINKLW